GDAHLRNIFSYAEKVSKTAFPFLITGETGTGKELIARDIHEASGRKGNYVAVNVSGLDDTILSDTLFGHVKGAYTSADSSRKGLIREAQDGTIFLDEIGDISMQSQVKLLRLIQSGEYYPLGSDICLKSNARIVAATNRNLPELIQQGSFRKDLYYRLRTHWIDITPLRKRKNDIRILFDHFLRQASTKMNRPVPGYSPELVTMLMRYEFPGNGRELEGMIYDAAAAAEDDHISTELFMRKIGGGADSSECGMTADSAPCPPDDMINVSGGYFPTIREVEDILIRKALEATGGNQGTAASLLGISRQTLNMKLKKTK
ncbi:MAG TPA: sigma-54 dependent transcriptional regulator, partial [Spirochaetota bacterium]|nr:sigma-54 dependent transcriptional regulator [Spirochaetota bacterium]